MVVTDQLTTCTHTHQPLPLAHIQLKLKLSGISIAKDKLMDILDQLVRDVDDNSLPPSLHPSLPLPPLQCVTFTLPQDRAHKKPNEAQRH